MRDLTGKLGKLLFPDVEKKKGRRIVVQIIAGLFIALLSVAGMLFYQHQEVKQQQKFQQIKGMYRFAESFLPKSEKNCKLLSPHTEKKELIKRRYSCTLPARFLAVS